MPSRRELLLGAAGMASLAGLARAVHAAQPTRNLIIVNADGGWDPTFTIDPKPGVDGIDGPYVDVRTDRDPLEREVIGTWGEIDVTLNIARRPRVTQFFEDHGERVTVVRGLWVGSVSHPVCRRRVLTGSDELGRPDVATIVGAELGLERAVGVVDLVGSASFGAWSHLALRGGRTGQLGGLIEPGARPPLADGTPRPLWNPAADEQALIEQWLADRGADDAATRPWRQEHLDARADARRRATELRGLGPQLEPLMGGRNLESQVPLVVELLKNGGCSAVVMDTNQGWDTHFGHDQQHGNFDRTFQGLDALARGLHEAGLYQDTLVAVVSEMARTPRRNADGGTDHWPYTSAMLFGAGVAGGRVVGGTDDGIVGLGCDLETGVVVPGGPLLSYASFAAGLLEHVGVDPQQWLPGVQPLRGFRA